jgi:asparagine synthase (glutamine-hydrolysing)
VPEYVEELLSPGHIQNSNIFDPTAVSALVNKFKLNRAIGTKDNMALVGVLSTQLVLDRFIKHSQEYEQCTQTSLTKYANSL